MRMSSCWLMFREYLPFYFSLFTLSSVLFLVGVRGGLCPVGCGEGYEMGFSGRHEFS